MRTVARSWAVGPSSLWFPTTMMNRLFNNKRKKSPELPHPDSTGIPTNVAAGRVSYDAQSNIGLEGGRNRSYQDPRVDPDLTATR